MRAGEQADKWMDRSGPQLPLKDQVPEIGSKNACSQDGGDDQQRDICGYLKCIMEQHLHTDKEQQRCKAHLQVMETVHDVHHQEEEGTQPQDGENVGEKDDVG